ncbi:extracellular solute-binding protein family 1 [Methylobacterium sp. 4-46]|uniref:ABC transporter substrate-binding protein n=1 Tax=unclassified Methylobacterium TaxID=2615210 RepID=UPI000152CEEA|nr:MULTISPECIES: extracellular solute-binding protein [Methylobacterium]ACA15835.1 extracellular solute-binding protein family 1 [Methylobacterium sp. 4-46]WFT81563.1 extracellular solute-binding protein [Methylobacterium nodulans]
MGRGRVAALVLGAALAAGGARAAEPTQITMWSNWPDEPAKREWVSARVKEFEAANAQCRVKLSFIPKADIYTQAKSAVRTGQAPDVFYMEPDQPEFLQGGFLEPLETRVDTGAIEEWAKPAWTAKGHLYGLPVEAYTVELYYNRDLVRKVGVAVPESGQLTQGAFADLVRKGVAAGVTPVAQGVGDRPFPGGLLLFESLLRKLGTEDYGKLLSGDLSFRDPRVLAVMTWFKDLVDAGAYPKSFSTLKLGESHYYFYQKPGALVFPDPSWFTGRAFAPPESGGMPADFPLGIMQFPAMDEGRCPTCKTLSVAGSFVVYARSRNKDCAGALLRSIGSVENGTKWMEQVSLQTGLKSDPSRIKSAHEDYFRQLQARNQGVTYFFGTPLFHYRAKCAETYTQVINNALPAGLISVKDAAERMDAACHKGS